jgi:tetratricopeptide (TPR) repeat protein
MSRPGLHKIFSVFVTVLLLAAVRSQGAGAPSDEDAYEHNRQGMIAMSKADFEEAIAEFQAAAALAEDYQITGRPLIYTPVFMTAWANEKIGRTREACGEFRHFLAIAPRDSVEETKADHARDYLKQNCP